MAVPSRKNEMMKNIIKNQELKKKKLKANIVSKEITEEEHEERLNKLKELGLIK